MTQGERLGDDALAAQLSRRKVLVDRAKQVERQKHKLDAFDDDGDESMTTLGAGVVRGVGGGAAGDLEDVLPLAPPSMAAYRLQMVQPSNHGNHGLLAAFGDDDDEVRNIFCKPFLGLLMYFVSRRKKTRRRARRRKSRFPM